MTDKLVEEHPDQQGHRDAPPSEEGLVGGVVGDAQGGIRRTC
ncbi:hypothetical protein [Microbacterium sp.]